MKTSIFKFALIAGLAVILLSGCRKDFVTQPSEATKVSSMDDLKVSGNFNWEMTREVTLQIGMNFPGVEYQYNSVMIYNGDPANDGKLVYQGFAGNDAPMVAKMRIPTAISQLHIQLVPWGQPNLIVILPVSSNIVYTFTESSLKNTKSVVSVGPDCSAATDPFILTGNSAKTIDDGNTYYVTTTYSGDVTIKDGKLIICGLFTGSIDMGQNGPKPMSYLEVSASGTIGSAGAPVTISKKDNSRFSNWGTVHIAGVFTPQDLTENYNVMTVYGQYNTNGSNGKLVNYGILKINSHWNVINWVENYKTIEVFGDMNCNNSDFLNACKLIVHGTFHLNNCRFTNQTGYIKCDLELKVQGGQGFMKLIDQSMIETYDLTVNADITGITTAAAPGTRNTIKVTHDFRFDGPNVITGTIEAAQTTGVLVPAHGGPSNFTGGATFVSFANMTNSIPSTECNGGGTNPPPPPPPPPVNNWVEGTAVYEDLWPGKGDYDVNDLVMAYKFKLVTNNENKVTDIVIKLLVKAVGASFKNGFGIQFDNLAPSDIASVTGSNLQRNYITLASNGVEAGQSKAVVIAFDDADNVIHRAGSSFFFNTEHNAPVGTADTVTLNIHLAVPMLSTVVGTPPYNPFLIRNLERQAEIHLPNYVPTSLATDCSYFGTVDDNSIPAFGRYYKTVTNLPWALNIPVTFDYPWEKTSILDAYNYFAAWAQSDGVLHPDWYLDLSGYRNSANIWHP